MVGTGVVEALGYGVGYFVEGCGGGVGFFEAVLDRVVWNVVVDLV